MDIQEKASQVPALLGFSAPQETMKACWVLHGCFLILPLDHLIVLSIFEVGSQVGIICLLSSVLGCVSLWEDETKGETGAQNSLIPQNFTLLLIFELLNSVVIFGPSNGWQFEGLTVSSRILKQTHLGMNVENVFLKNYRFVNRIYIAVGITSFINVSKNLLILISGSM